MRQIDADSFIVHVALYMAENAYLNDTALDVLKKVSSWLEETHTLDYAPVRHSEWIMVSPDGSWGVCKACNRSDGIDPIATHCRYCGARMDGGKRNENA